MVDLHVQVVVAEQIVNRLAFTGEKIVVQLFGNLEADGLGVEALDAGEDQGVGFLHCVSKGKAGKGTARGTQGPVKPKILVRGRHGYVPQFGATRADGFPSRRRLRALLTLRRGAAPGPVAAAGRLETPRT